MTLEELIDRARPGGGEAACGLRPGVRPQDGPAAPARPAHPAGGGDGGRRAVRGRGGGLCRGPGGGLPDLAAAVEALFGDGSRGSTQAREAYDDLGRQTLNLPNRERVTLEYADGTSYVVRDQAADLDNTEYALVWPRGEEQVFNRLADPDQVRAVTVNGARYSVE